MEININFLKGGQGIKQTKPHQNVPLERQKKQKFKIPISALHQLLPHDSTCSQANLKTIML